MMLHRSEGQGSSDLDAFRGGPSGMAWAIKLAMDRIIAVAALLTLSPFILLVTIAILTVDGRPILFLQPRYGRDGRVFEAKKFRTMRSGSRDTSGSSQTADNDARVTQLGKLLRKTSFDEVPQLLNVLRGEMNVTGPRAHPCRMTVDGILCEVLDPRYHNRHRVAPGLTGWAQVNRSRGAVKSAASLSRRVTLDVEYVEGWTPALELRILWRTLRVLIHNDRGV